MVWIGGISDVASKGARDGVLFFAPFDGTKEVATLHRLGFEVFGVVAFSVFPFNACAEGFFSEKDKVEISDRGVKAASFDEPIVNREVKNTGSQGVVRGFQCLWITALSKVLWR